MSKLLSRLELLTSSSFIDELPFKVIQNLRNSSAQFIILLAEKIKITYTYTILAIHLTHTFFHSKSYLSHDRFYIAGASLVLACKILDHHVDLRSIASKFYNLHCELVLGEKKELITDALTKIVKEKICQAEENIVSALKYNFSMAVPTQYVPKLIPLLVEPSLKEKVFKLSKIFVLDFYRTGGSLFYKPLDIMLAAILLANYVIGSKRLTREYLVFHENARVGQMSLLKSVPRSLDNSMPSSMDSENHTNIFTKSKMRDHNTKFEEHRSFHFGLESFEGAPGVPRREPPVLSKTEDKVLREGRVKQKTTLSRRCSGKSERRSRNPPTLTIFTVDLIRNTRHVKRFSPKFFQ